MKPTEVLGGPDYIKLVTGWDVVEDGCGYAKILITEDSRYTGSCFIELRIDGGFFEIKVPHYNWISYHPNRTRRYVLNDIKKSYGIDFDPFHAIVEPNGTGIGLF